jgi:hypothetical protein
MKNNTDAGGEDEKGEVENDEMIDLSRRLVGFNRRTSR